MNKVLQTPNVCNGKFISLNRNCQLKSILCVIPKIYDWAIGTIYFLCTLVCLSAKVVSMSNKTVFYPWVNFVY